MNTIFIQGDWNILKGKLKQTWSLLTGDDLQFNEGKAEEYLGRIQKKTGEKRAALERSMKECDELRMQIDRFSKRQSSSNQCERPPQRPWGILRKEMCCSL